MLQPPSNFFQPPAMIDVLDNYTLFGGLFP